MRKKTALLLIPALLFFTLIPPSAFASGGGAPQFREGSLKIMIIADIQDGANVSKYTMELIEKSLAAESPDLVVLLGDNVFGMVPSLQNEANVKKSIDTFMAPIVSRKIPFCAVFGNHDGESAMSNAEQMEYFRAMPGCLASAGDVTGVGNYNLVISGTDGLPAANLVFFDSGSYAPEGEWKYAYVADDQLAWFRAASEQLESAAGRAVPAYVFQHIAVPEIYDVLQSADKDTAGAVRGQVGWSDGYYKLNPEYAEGYLGEGPCPPDRNNGEFQSWLDSGNVVAAFFGHDHVNDFIAHYQGIDFVYTPGAGFHSYGSGYRHGVRIVTLPESAPEQYETRMVYFGDLTDTRVPGPLLYTGRYVFSLILFGSAGILLLLAAAVLITLKFRRKKRLSPETR